MYIGEKVVLIEKTDIWVTYIKHLCLKYKIKKKKKYHRVKQMALPYFIHLQLMEPILEKKHGEISI